jgi:hypothetical protein
MHWLHFGVFFLVHVALLAHGAGKREQQDYASQHILTLLVHPKVVAIEGC